MHLELHVIPTWSTKNIYCVYTSVFKKHWNFKIYMKYINLLFIHISYIFFQIAMFFKIGVCVYIYICIFFFFQICWLPIGDFCWNFSLAMVNKMVATFCTVYDYF